MTLEDLLEQPLLLREPGSGTRALFDQAVAASGKMVQPTWESASTAALIQGVLWGHGVAVLPQRLVQADIDEGRLATIALRDVSLQRTFYIIYHKNKYISVALRDFIALAKENGGAET